MPPPSRQFRSWDSYPEPPTTPMALPYARDDYLHLENYYYRGPKADPGYTDPIRMPMYGTDLYSNTRGGNSSSSNQGIPVTVAEAVTNLKATTTLCSTARHQQYHLHHLSSQDNLHGWVGIILYLGEAVSGSKVIMTFRRSDTIG